MIPLTILTTNPEKRRQAEAVFASDLFDLDFLALETPEIQAHRCEDVAHASALFAYERLRRPLALTDAGFFIPALNGFPGPLLKFVNDLLTAEDLLRLMAPKRDRRIELREVVAFIDHRGPPVTFPSTIRGSIAETPRGIGRTFDRLFIPEGFDQTAAELGKDAMNDLYVRRFTHWRALREFLLKEPTRI